jgi:hypothetical protein
MLVTASWFEEFKDDFGIQGVSQVWCDRPAWYFWISKAPGVYQLRLEDAEAIAGGGVRGVFAVKCYPYRGTAAYEGFSAEERGVVESELFDHTGTPRAEVRGQIPDTLFNVAALEIALAPDGGILKAVLESLDRMIVRSGAEADPALGGNGNSVPGELVRNVPAWDLAYPLFDRIICLLVHYRRQKPLRVLMTRASGFEYEIVPQQAPVCRDSDAAAVYTMTLSFSSPQIFIQPARPDEGDDGSDVIFDHRSACGHFHPPDSTVPLVGDLNPSWWSLADMHFKSNLASTCGCEH